MIKIKNNNNCKILDKATLDFFKNKYVITYEKESNKIKVGFYDYALVTYHDADKPFHIRCKKLNRKVCFNINTIDIWKELQLNDKTKHITLFDVHNNAIILKCTYQEITLKKIVELYKKGFNSIKTV